MYHNELDIKPTHFHSELYMEDECCCFGKYNLIKHKGYIFPERISVIHSLPIPFGIPYVE